MQLTTLFSMPAPVSDYQIYWKYSKTSENVPPHFSPAPPKTMDVTRRSEWHHLCNTAFLHSIGHWHHLVPFTPLPQVNDTLWKDNWKGCITTCIKVVRIIKKSSFCPAHLLIFPILLTSPAFPAATFPWFWLHLAASLHFQMVTASHYQFQISDQFQLLKLI